MVIFFFVFLGGLFSFLSGRTASAIMVGMILSPELGLKGPFAFGKYSGDGMKNALHFLKEVMG